MCRFKTHKYCIGLEIKLKQIIYPQKCRKCEKKIITTCSLELYCDDVYPEQIGKTVSWKDGNKLRGSKRTRSKFYHYNMLNSHVYLPPTQEQQTV